MEHSTIASCRVKILFEGGRVHFGTVIGKDL